MSLEPAAQTPGKHEIVTRLDREFVRLHLNSCAIIQSTPAEVLYEPGRLKPGGAPAASSVGESILRSAAIIEQTFGGITANLWDDPFEWTLPEYLATPRAISAHLAEVEATRRRAFSSFTVDDCLEKQVMIPAGEAVPLVALLQTTLQRATAFQHQALAMLAGLSGIRPSGFII